MWGFTHLSYFWEKVMGGNPIFKTEKSLNGYLHCKRNPGFVKGNSSALSQIARGRLRGLEPSPSIGLVTGCFQHWIFIECCSDTLMAI